MKISALILAKNEEEMISGCIKQLNFVDEIIVLDQNSNDKTVEIAKSLGAKIIRNASGQFDLDRSTLRQSAKEQWLLYVDADERFDDKVVNEIKSVVKENKKGAYYFARKNIVLGKWLKHGGWWPDYVPRFFSKEILISWQGRVHESPEVDGPVYYAKNPIKHLTARSISRMLNKSIKWAKIEAELYAQANYPKVTKKNILKKMLGQFMRRYILKSGFMDGKVGLIQAIFQTLHVAMTLTYLWEIQNKTESDFKNLR